MFRFCLLFFATSGFAATLPDSVLELSRQGPLLFANEVYINHHGPFRMLVDTGSASSVIPQAIARRIGLTPTYAVEQETPAGSKRVAATLLDEVKTGSVTSRGVEVLMVSSGFVGFDGVLGQSWLGGRDYLLDYRGRRLVFDPDPPASGLKMALRDVEGRPAVAARVGGREVDLVLDSGAEALVLFGPSPLDNPATMFTANGPVPVGRSRAAVALSGERPRSVDAVHVSGPERPGLLPLSDFSAVYISNRDGVAVLVRPGR